MFCVGSGSTLAYSILDTYSGKGKQKLSELPLEEAIDTAVWAVRHSTFRDGFSGGFINVLQINSSGVHHIKRVDSQSLKLYSN